jgi:hypothetical protein
VGKNRVPDLDSVSPPPGTFNETNDNIVEKAEVLKDIAFRRAKKKPSPASRQKDLEITNPSPAHIGYSSMAIAAQQMGFSDFRGYRLVDGVNAIDHLTAQGKTAEAQAVRAAKDAQRLSNLYCLRCRQ